MKDKESTTRHDARAKNGISILPPVIDIHTPPTLELLLAYASSRGYTDEQWTRRWFDRMTNEFFWCFPTSGDPIKHWPAYFRSGYLNEHPTRRGAKRKKHDDVKRPANFLAADENQMTEFENGLA